MSCTNTSGLNSLLQCSGPAVQTLTLHYTAYMN
jgi:hypothetical protein